LITYIIISEATRVIPVRNVIPAPWLYKMYVLWLIEFLNTQLF
jgi:hypothetical protein